MNKCPKCDASFSEVTVASIPSKGLFRANCITFNCPHCNASLGVAIHPKHLIDETIKAVEKRIR